MTNEHILIMTILALSIMTQAMAAVTAFRLIPITGRRSAWGLIALALTLMALRRVVPLYRLITGDATIPPDLFNEVIGLALSVIMAAGIARIAPLFVERRQIEETLQIQYSTVHSILESVDALFFSINRQYQYTGFNSAHASVMKTIYGATIQVGHSLLDYMTVPEDREKARRNLDRALAGEQHVETAYSGEEKRSRLYFEVSHSPIHAEDGSVIGVAVFSRDVSQRRRAEEQVRASEERLNQAQRIAHIGSWELDLATNTLEWSDGIYRIFEIDPNEFGASYEAFLDLIHPDDREMVNQAYTSSVRDKVPYDIVHRLKFPDGRIKFVRERCETYYDADKPIRSLGTVQDITEHKRSEDALQRSAEEIQDMYDRAPCGYHSLDGQGVIIRINNTELQWLGYTRDEVVGKINFSSLVTGRSLQIFRESFPLFKERGWVKDLEFDLIRKDGTLLPALVSSTAVYDAAGNFVMSRSTVYDVTERRRAEQALHERERHSQSLLRLSQKMEQALTYSDVLSAALEEVKEVIGYQNLWVYLLNIDKENPEEFIAKGPMFGTLTMGEARVVFPIEDNRMIEEIITTKGIVVVEDAQTDERTNKVMAAQLGSRTIVNVPIISLERHLGSVGTGTFGEEGVHVPTESEQTYLSALASHMAVTLDRIHLQSERQRVENALRESEEKYRLLHENAGVGIGYYTPDGRIISFNQLAASHMGGKPEDFTGRSIYEVFPQQEADFYMGRINRSLGAEGTIEYEDHINLPSGDKWFLSVFAKIRDSQQNVTGVQIISQDITDRKHVENALRESETRYRSLFEDSPIPLWEEDFSMVKEYLDNLRRQGVTDLMAYMDEHPETLFECISRLRVLDVNRATLKVFGAQSKEELLTNLDRVFGPGSLAVIREELDALFHEQSEFEGIAVNHKLTGELIHAILRWSITPGHEQTLSRVILSMIDITGRKQAEDALRESEYKLGEAARIAHVGYWDRDYVAETITLSDEACQIFGLPPTKHFSKLAEWHTQWLKLIHPEDQPKVARVLTDALAGGPPYNVDYRVVRPDGDVRYIHSHAELTRDEAGSPLRLFGTMIDITERKQAEEALRASENRFRVLSENAFVGIYIIQDGRLTYVNSTLAKIFGYTLDELTGADPRIVIHPDDHALVLENIRRRIDGEAETVHYEFRGRSKDGGTKNIEVLGGRIDFAGKTAVIGNLMDITDRKKAEEEIARSLAAEKKARRVAEILRDANESLSRTLHLDDVLQNLLDYLMHLVPYDSANVMLREGNFEVRVVASQGYEHWTNNDVVRKLVFDIRTIPSLNQLITTQKSMVIANTYEYPGWLRVPGTEHIVSWLGIPIIADGQVIGLYSVDKVEPAFFTDEHRLLAEGLAAQAAVAIQNTRLHDQVTRANVELEERVTRRTAQLEAANRELEAFAYSVSHDLRAPLRHIDGFIEMLRKKIKVPLDEQSQHYMTVIADSARDMGKLIDDLLSFSRMGRNEMTTSQVDLRGLIDDVINECRLETADRNIEWRVGDLPLVKGDTSMLKMALTNLISNALKFTRPREIVQIEIGCETKDQEEAVFFIRDNGVGFDMAYADKLFGVFQRLHGADEFEGTGIGLANVRRIVNRHGGRVWAEGKVDQGATFYFSLPQ